MNLVLAQGAVPRKSGSTDVWRQGAFPFHHQHTGQFLRYNPKVYIPFHDFKESSSGLVRTGLSEVQLLPYVPAESRFLKYITEDARVANPGVCITKKSAKNPTIFN